MDSDIMKIDDVDSGLNEAQEAGELSIAANLFTNETVLVQKMKFAHTKPDILIQTIQEYWEDMNKEDESFTDLLQSISTEAVCPNNPPYERGAAADRSVCRVFLNKGSGFGYCSGTMVPNLGESGFRTFALAAHCVLSDDSEREFDVADLEEYPSFVCCGAPDLTGEPSLDAICPISGRWRVRAITASKSFVDGGLRVNDGAMLGLTFYEDTDKESVSLIPWAYPTEAALCDPERAYIYTGYPIVDEMSEGCTSSNINPQYLYYSVTLGTLNCESFTSSGLDILGSGCRGISGGPLLTLCPVNGDVSLCIIGTLSGEKVECSDEGTSFVVFSVTTQTGSVGLNPRQLIGGLERNQLLIL
eukprot:jgi/Picsp_1/3203/NSC_06043-R1_---NA---